LRVKLTNQITSLQLKGLRQILEVFQRSLAVLRHGLLLPEVTLALGDGRHCIIIRYDVESLHQGLVLVVA